MFNLISKAMYKSNKSMLKEERLALLGLLHVILWCSHTIAYALRMQIVESVCNFRKTVFFQTPSIDHKPLQTYD